MMKMHPEKISSKVKHFQIMEKKKFNGENTKGDKQRQKKAVKVVQIMEKSVMHPIQVNIR